MNRRVCTQLALAAAMSLSACARRDTSSEAPAPASQTPIAEVQSPDQQVLIDRAQLDANDDDLERLEEINSTVDLLAQEYLQSVDALQQDVQSLADLGEQYKIPQRRLNSMTTAALAGREVKIDARIPRGAREAIQARLESVRALAPKVYDAPVAIAERQRQIEELNAEARQRNANLQGRSNAVAVSPGRELHPELRADREHGNRLANEIAAKAEAAAQTFAEATMRAKQLEEALGIDRDGPTKSRADISQAPGTGPDE